MNKWVSRLVGEWLGGCIGAGVSCLLFGPPGFNWCFSFAPGFSKLFCA